MSKADKTCAPDKGQKKRILKYISQISRSQTLAFPLGAQWTKANVCHNENLARDKRARKYVPKINRSIVRLYEHAR